jgi:hypothetical protein
METPDDVMSMTRASPGERRIVDTSAVKGTAASRSFTRADSSPSACMAVMGVGGAPDCLERSSPGPRVSSSSSSRTDYLP